MGAHARSLRLIEEGLTIRWLSQEGWQPLVVLVIKGGGVSWSHDLMVSRSIA